MSSLSSAAARLAENAKQLTAVQEMIHFYSTKPLQDLPLIDTDQERKTQVVKLEAQAEKLQAQAEKLEAEKSELLKAEAADAHQQGRERALSVSQVRAKRKLAELTASKHNDVLLEGQAESFAKMEQDLEELKDEKKKLATHAEKLTAEIGRYEANTKALQAERSALMVDASVLYARGYVELILKGLADRHGGAACACEVSKDKVKTATQMMAHWLDCALVKQVKKIEVLTEYRIGSKKITASAAAVKNALQGLYPTLSGMIHQPQTFLGGEDFVLPVSQLAVHADNLALFTLLQHHSIAFQVVE